MGKREKIGGAQKQALVQNSIQQVQQFRIFRCDSAAHNSPRAGDNSGKRGAHGERLNSSFPILHLVGVPVKAIPAGLI